MSIYVKCEPRSREWFYMRLGVPTSSEFHKIVTPGGKLSSQAEGYAHTLLAEAMLGRPLESPETQWMVRGQELEDEAIKAYELLARETSPGGFITNDECTLGCSPDRLVGDDGILEMKVPAPNTHVGYLVSRDFGKEKWPQVQGQLLVSGRKWVDLMSYHPELPPIIVRAERDEKYMAVLEPALASFVKDLREMRNLLIAKYGPFPEIKLAEESAPEGDFDVTDEDLDAMFSAGISVPSA